MRNMVLAMAFIAVAAASACGGNGEDPEGGGGSGGIGGGHGGTGGTDHETPPCEVDADCAPGEFCLEVDGAITCAELCETDADCTREGERCIQTERGGGTVCRPADPTECETDADCSESQLCIDGFCLFRSNCETDADCAGGESCISGACMAGSTGACESTADCVTSTAYCAALPDGDACVDVSCGSEINSCGRCELGPNAGARDANGPVIFFPEQVGSCALDPSQCLPGAAPWVCEFSFLAFDLEGNLPTSSLDNRINVISRNGARLSVFGTRAQAAGTNTQNNFRLCMQESDSGIVGSAVVLSDTAGDDSQTLCIDGSL